MSDDQSDPWAQIKELQAENAELRAELRTCHEMLDGAGVSNEEGRHRLTTDDDSINVRLPARLMRFIMHELGCPMRRIR